MSNLQGMYPFHPNGDGTRYPIRQTSINSKLGHLSLPVAQKLYLSRTSPHLNYSTAIVSALKKKVNPLGSYAQNYGTGKIKTYRAPKINKTKITTTGRGVYTSVNIPKRKSTDGFF